MAEELKVAVVGAGYWGPNLIRNVSEAPGAVLRMICDQDEKRLKDVGRRYPGTQLVSDFEDVLRDREIDAVVLATPASVHAVMGIRAMEAGKDVLIEKPLATSVEECRQLIDCSERTGRVLMVGHTFIFNSAVRMIQQIVSSGEIGEVLYVYSSRVNLGRIRQDVNALWNVAPHDISILNHVLGKEPIRVRALGRSYLQPGIEDVVFAVFEYPGGLLAHVHSSWLDPSKVRRTTFVGSKKMIIYDDVESEGKIKIYDKGVRRQTPEQEYGEFQIRLHDGDIHIPKIRFTEPLADECKHFIECCKTRQRPETDGRDGLAVVAALEAAQESLRLGGDLVEIESFSRTPG
ncbi:MAG TPA: Gfo/Idh/MocA family oxidoreductase [bacterium]|nr:Gfo/Idh/MocA family oxidoreductase [bacterium]